MSNPQPPPPPPKRTVAAVPKPNLPYSSSAPPTNESWKDWSKRKGNVWGKTAVVKGVSWSDKIGTKMNGWAEQYAGTERFYPVTGDFPQEMAKCARILRLFTVDGIESTVAVPEDKAAADAKAKGKKKQVTVHRKIPAAVIKNCKGLAIFTSMRSGIMPLAGAGGAGVIVAKLPDGSWSAPSAMSPNNLSVGAMLGVDIYDCVLVINSDEALETFKSWKVTLGAEIAIAAGPYGAGAAGEMGTDKVPVYSYIKSRGVYAGIEAVAQIFVTRTEENETTYFWPGVVPKDILEGRVKIPREAEELMNALEDAETGRAQRAKGNEFEFDEPFPVTDTALVDLNEGAPVSVEKRAVPPPPPPAGVPPPYETYVSPVETGPIETKGQHETGGQT